MTKLRSQLSFNDNISKKNLQTGGGLQFTKKTSPQDTKNNTMFDSTQNFNRLQSSILP